MKNLWIPDQSSTHTATTFTTVTHTTMRLLYVLNFFAFISVVSAFTFLPKSFRQKIMKNPLLMSNVAIVGVAGGAAETIAVRFSEEGFNVHAILDRKPFSPALNKAAADGKVETYVIDNIQSLESVIGKNGRQLGTSNILSDKSVVIIGGDDGDTMFRGARSRDQVSESNVLLDRLFKVIPPSVKGVVCTSSAVSDPITPQGLGNFLGPKGSSAWKKWCTDNSKPFSLVRFGSLTGGVSGAEPIPFVGMPLLEPELHPSYVLRSVVLADPASNKYAATEVCTRDSLAEGVVQLVKRSLSLEALMVSIAGRPPASSEWDKLFARFSTSRNAELLRVSMGAILKPQPFANWIVEQWFPQVSGFMLTDDLVPIGVCHATFALNACSIDP